LLIHLFVHLNLKLIKTLIIEDEAWTAKKLAHQLGQINPAIEVVNTFDTVEDSVKYLTDNQSVDLIFMDIHLADGTSFDIFRQVEVNAPVVFTTAYDQYMVDAFQHHSIDYILKPTKKEALEQSLKKYNRWYNAPDMSNYATLLQWDSAIKKVYKERFLVQAGKKLLPISVKDMAYFYADAKFVMVALKNGREYIVNHTLAELEQLIDPVQFYRINRKAIVNIDAVKSLQMGKNYKWMLHLEPVPDFKVPIPTDKLTDFKEWVS